MKAVLGSALGRWEVAEFRVKGRVSGVRGNLGKRGGGALDRTLEAGRSGRCRQVAPRTQRSQKAFIPRVPSRCSLSGASAQLSSRPANLREQEQGLTSSLGKSSERRNSLTSLLLGGPLEWVGNPSSFPRKCADSRTGCR